MITSSTMNTPYAHTHGANTYTVIATTDTPRIPSGLGVCDHADCPLNRCQQNPPFYTPFIRRRKRKHS